MSLTPSKVTWDPNRYKATEYVITYDSNGTPTLSKKEADYTGVNYNFSSLPSGTTTQTTTGTTTQQTGTTTQAQTAEAFGDVKPYYWNEGSGGNGGNQNQEITKTSSRQQPQLSGFFDPLDRAMQGKPVANLGTRIKQKFENITKSGEAEWEEVDAYIEREKEFQKNRALQAKYGTFEEYNKALDEIQGKTTTGFFTKPKDLAKKAYKKTGLKKAVDFLKPFPLKIADAMMDPLQKSTNSFNKNYFGVTNGIYENGRIAGNASTDLYAGMNAQSMFGNVYEAGKSRIEKREKTAATKKVSDKFKANTEKMKQQQQEYLENKAADRDRKSGGNTTTNVTGHGKSGFGRDTDYMGHGGGSSNSGGKSIICTQMYQQTQLEDWKKTMKLWYIFQKKYLTMEHQEGYHFLFRPFVNGMKKSKVLTTLGKHCAIARTNDIKHIMFGTPFSLSGRLVRLVTEPLCYITGKIKSWL